MGTAYLLLQKIFKFFRQSSLAALLLELAQLLPQFGNTSVIATSSHRHSSYGASTGPASQHCGAQTGPTLNAFACYLQRQTVVWLTLLARD